MTREESIKNTKLIARFMDNNYILAHTDDAIYSLGNLYLISWDRLMPVCKKIINMYFDRREVIFRGLLTCDIELTYNAVIAFLTFWYDSTQEKIDFNSQGEQQLKWDQNQN